MHPLPRGLAWPVLSFVNKFKDEFEARGAADEARHAVPSAEIRIAASRGLGQVALI
jgi:hypothetical protein